MNVYVTSDLHFGHKNILKYCPVTRSRFNNDVDYMNEQMVFEWNSVVQPNDLVYILGDVAFMPAPIAISFMNRLNGRKILIEGNHDNRLLENNQFRDCFIEIHSYLKIKHNGHDVIMFHYPIARFDKMYNGSIHLHGHCHGNTTDLEKFRVRDVGMDATGKVVSLLDDVILDALKGEFGFHHD